MTYGHRRTLTIARNLTADAPLIATAYQHLANETDRIEAWPATTLGDGTSRSTDTTTIVERELIRIDRLHLDKRQLDGMLKALADTHRDLVDLCHDILRHRDPLTLTEANPRCQADASHEGYNVPLEQGGWHDPTCDNHSRSRRGGLCNTCRVREDRWRTTRNVPELADERPIDHDSHVVELTNGVALARPIEIHA